MYEITLVIVKFCCYMLQVIGCSLTRGIIELYLLPSVIFFLPIVSKVAKLFIHVNRSDKSVSYLIYWFQVVFYVADPPTCHIVQNKVTKRNRLNKKCSVKDKNSLKSHF